MRILYLLLFAMLACNMDSTAPHRYMDSSRPTYSIQLNSVPVLDIHHPTTTKKGTIVWLHPGGWSKGTHLLSSSHWVLKLLSDSISVVSVAYTLSGMAPWPQQIIDVKNAMRFIRANADSLGLNTTKIGIIGYSAGAHLASMMGTTCMNPIYGMGTVDECPSAIVSISGPSDLLTMDRQLTNLGYAARANIIGSQEYYLLNQTLPTNDTTYAKTASPMQYTPLVNIPFFVLHGRYDTTVPYLQSNQLIAWLRSKSISVQQKLLSTTHAATAFGADTTMNKYIRPFFRTHVY